MEWMDDLSVRAKQIDSKVQNFVGKDVYAYLKSQFNSQAIKVVAPQKGNLTQEQIDQGLRGATPGLASPQATPSQIQNSASASQIMGSVGSFLPYVIAGVLGVFAFSFLTKKRRG
jgi:hypothetical protein